MLCARKMSRRSSGAGFSSLLEYSYFSSCGSVVDLVARRGGRGTLVRLMLCQNRFSWARSLDGDLEHLTRGPSVILTARIHHPGSSS